MRVEYRGVIAIRSFVLGLKRGRNKELWRWKLTVH